MWKCMERNTSTLSIIDKLINEKFCLIFAKKPNFGDQKCPKVKKLKPHFSNVGHFSDTKITSENWAGTKISVIEFKSEIFPLSSISGLEDVYRQQLVYQIEQIFHLRQNQHASSFKHSSFMAIFQKNASSRFSTRLILLKA